MIWPAGGPLSVPPLAPWNRPSDWHRFAEKEVLLPTADEMAEIDREAVRSGAICERSLIENAGREVARLTQARFPRGPVVVLAGSGHNGADGLVAGRTLAAAGRPVRLVSCGSRVPEPDVLAGWDLPVVSAPDGFDRALAGAEVILDGILGTGLVSEPRGTQAEAIAACLRASAPVVAVDGPSGVNFTTGEVHGDALNAAMTVTFGWPKSGLLRWPARARCGDLLCAEIGFPSTSPPSGAALAPARVITTSWAASMLGERSPTAHKGRAGYLAIVAGRRGMAGAALLAARAALRAGAGVVQVISDPSNRMIIQALVPEAVFVNCRDSGAARAACERSRAVVVGPGLGRDDTARELLEAAMSCCVGSALIDADGLNLLAERAQPFQRPTRGLLLTPHPGEMARLCGLSISEVQAGREDAAIALARQMAASVLLKGAPSIVASPRRRLRVTPLASPAFAAGGTGDVLSGVCGAYLAAGLRPADAATAALAVTGVAVTGVDAPVGLSSADIPDLIPAARRSVERADPGGWPGVRLALPAA